jgi:hypothetical protein
MPLTPKEEKRLREEIQNELINREQALRENRQKSEEEKQRRLEQRLREKIREEEEEKYFTEKGYVKYINHEGLMEWLRPDEADRRKKKRRLKKPSSYYKKKQKRRIIQIIINTSIVVIVGILLLVLYKFNSATGKNYGSIIVSSEVPGAKIFLDGIELNSFTPDTLTKISAGKHYLSVYKDGFTSWPPMEIIPVIAKKNTSVHFLLRNLPYFGRVNIESNLSNFDLYIDGLLQKITEPYLEIPVGYHVFALVKEGYLTSPSYQRILVEQEQIKTIKFEFMLEEEIGYFQISSNRKNGYIFLDNKFTGLKANGKQFPVKPGTYEISIRENGYLSTPNSKLENLLSNEKKMVVFRSRPIEEQETIQLLTKNPGAAIILDGNWTLFITPIQNLAVSPGNHLINFMRGDSIFSEKDILIDLAQIKDNSLKYNF